MRNQISYKLAVARMYAHGYEVSNRVHSNICVSHFNAKSTDEQDRLGKLVKEQADIVCKYEKKLKSVLRALSHVERRMSRPQRRELNLLRERCCGPWLIETKEKTKINDAFWLDCLALDTFDDFDPGVDDFDPIEDYNESRLDYMEDNFQDYGD